MAWSIPIPSILLPSFTWTPRTPRPLAVTMPPTPRITPYWLRLFWGLVHRFLFEVGWWYCGWANFPFNRLIIELPFGLVLKWTDRARLEEVLAMQVARAAGLPVPKVICYGEHPGKPRSQVSILMTRIPGEILNDVFKSLSSKEEETIASELKSYLDTMRAWQNPWEPGQVCSITGGPIWSVRVPMDRDGPHHQIGPCENEKVFKKALISPARRGPQDEEKKWQRNFAHAKKFLEMSHRVVFTHGDIKDHNIMIHNGHVSGFLDWETAGWYPEYWDFTTSIYRFSSEIWWYKFMMKLGCDKYVTELHGDRALHSVTCDSVY